MAEPLPPRLADADALLGELDERPPLPPPWPGESLRGWLYRGARFGWLGDL